jgi:hypothetical protein
MTVRDPLEDAVDERPLPERWIDELLPDDFDWVETVQRYPLLAIGVAAAGGFYIGKVHGNAILDAVTSLAANRLDETADRFVSLAGQRGE